MARNWWTEDGWMARNRWRKSATFSFSLVGFSLVVVDLLMFEKHRGKEIDFS